LLLSLEMLFVLPWSFFNRNVFDLSISLFVIQYVIVDCS
jgi:hypothetical protein